MMTGFARSEVRERHDMQVLESGHESCFGFKTADEVGLVRKAGQDDLDSNLAAYGRLVGAIDGPKAPGAYSVE